MEEELKEWTIPISIYRDIYHRWVRINNEDSLNSECFMWEVFNVYTNTNFLEYDCNGNFVFQIKDAKKFSMARIKYDF